MIEREHKFKFRGVSYRAVRRNRVITVYEIMRRGDERYTSLFNLDVVRTSGGTVVTKIVNSRKEAHAVPSLKTFQEKINPLI